MSRLTESACLVAFATTFAILFSTQASKVPTTSHLTITYDDIVATNKSCKEKDSCELRKTDRKMDLVDWKVRNCFCDAQCRDYGDCCVDSKFFDAVEQRRNRQAFSCVSLRQFGTIYMKDSCPEDFDDDEYVAKCRDDASPIEDPLATMPVTSKATTHTYKNYYCAACHNDVTSPIVWVPRLECPSIKSGVVEDLTPSVVSRQVDFDPVSKRWGVRTGEGEFHVCHIDPVIPEFIAPYVRSCRIHNGTCPEGTDADLAAKCDSYSAYVYNFERAFRNVHCAQCNNVTLSNHHCIMNDFSRGIFGEEFDVAAFSVLLDISLSSASHESASVGKVAICEPNQLYDPFFKRCRDLYRPKPSAKNGTDASGNATNNASTTTCPKFTLLDTDFDFVANDSIFVAMYNKTYSSGDYEIVKLGDGKRAVRICAVGLADADKFTPLMGYVSAICILVSILCLLCHLVATAFVPELRNLSGKNMAALSTALLLAYVFFLAGQFRTVKEHVCAGVGAGMYFSFLAAFCWMNCMAFDVWRSLRRATSELRLSSGSQFRKFAAYSAYAWGLPAVLVAVALVADSAPGVALALRPGFGVASCWFGHRTALLVYFAAPLAVVMAMNVVFFGLSAGMIYATSESSRKIRTGCNPTRIDFKLYTRLALIMGLTWVVGLVVGALDGQLEPHSLLFFALWYLFIALNALQGLFIFATFTCTKKVRNGFRDRWQALQRRRGPGKESFSWSFSNSGLSEGGKKRIIESQDSTDSQLSATMTSGSGAKLGMSPSGAE
ncbi:unnamed protein product [Notodromas monacha]|uniref:G-protein coupled receptors family 2 profile 2 domain-containing protein n=1 Tax=Notodromas monacha TaxID=399045 RepID=A0A7R9BVE7_9CRUS|nr:unnamed protein product [Notodromas monacha]CAG0921325.1 unnamed protein product [Notodromas monacha]